MNKPVAIKNQIILPTVLSEYFLGGANLACAYATPPPKRHFFLGGGVAIFFEFFKTYLSYDHDSMCAREF